ncbi:chromosomal replication initiator protein DnaA [Candidatus Magnetaquicoccus inordinatus]|uniref:chromosomal replication initiator protein DnaA n=1 Tax=Candidatus Magnetaquicoccus inordinatus TaxID=2496818 RepID=UPI00102AA3EB|nr:chromosomal replication initiator protein DnaA [Candidatus Magnetaquicoccus inordinatus]
MEEYWLAALAAIQGEVTPQVYNMWFKPLCLGAEMADGRVELLAPSGLAVDYVRNHYGILLEKKLSQLAERSIRIVLRAAPQQLGGVEEPSPELLSQLAPPASGVVRGGLDPRYTFASFVVGSCNQFAHAAAARVAEEPAKIYNPLFIHGGVGLGKTHLLHAIGNHLLEHRPSLKVQYISSEKFMTQMIESLRFQRVHDFKELFRSIDVLLVDDIQFIAGKKSTQEEFFHTFNALHETNRQIVLSSDRFPAQMELLEERLRSRFSWGLLADIHAPDLETRVAILKKKAAVEGIDLQNDVAFFLADAIQSNIRELEGALIRVLAMASVEKVPVTMALVVESLRHVVRAVDRRQVTIEEIQKKVAEYYQIRVIDLRSAKRARQYSHPRQIAMYLCKQLTKHSFPEIGKQFGDRDHTTVMHAVRKIDEQQIVDSDLAEELRTLTGMLRR